jgi:lysophospholipase L1-like esterase
MFDNMTLKRTSAGLNQVSATQDGGKIQFTRIALGSGAATDASVIAAMNALVNQKLSVNVSDVVTSGTNAILRASYSRSDVAEAFTWKEIGLFALDADENEILFAYASDPGSATVVSPTTGVTTTQVKITIAISDASASFVPAPTSAMMTWDEFFERMADVASAYDVWLSMGHTGSKADFLAAITGPTGPAGSVNTTQMNAAISAALTPAAAQLAEVDMKSIIDRHASIMDAIVGSNVLVNVAGAPGATASLTACGKNVYNEATTPFQNYSSIYAFSGGLIRYANTDGIARNVLLKCYGLKPGRMYTISLANLTGSNSVVSFIQRTAAGAQVGSTINMYGTSTAKTFLAEATMNYLEVQITSPGTTTVCDYTFNLQIEEGGEATAYEPYSGSTQTVNCNTVVTKTAKAPMHIFVPGLGNVLTVKYPVAAQADDAVINCFGDSLTLGGATVSFPSVLATLCGRTVNNFGVGGETSLTIAGRQGGFPFMVQPFTIPATVSAVAVTLKSAYMNGLVAPLVGSGVPDINPCTINGIKGTLSLSGGVYYFTRAVQGIAAVPVTRPVPLITNAMRARRNGITIIWTGTNGGWTDTDGVTYKSEVLVSQIRQMTEYLQNERYLVIGLTAVTAATYASLDAALIRTFGRKFLDLRGYILAYGLADAGITPTAQDNTDIAEGRIPTSLRVDGTHFNDAGYTVVGTQVYLRLLELGYI